MLELTESLACGGSLKVTLKDWKIVYYLQGPDRRHTPTFYTIDGTTIDSYILALKKNFSEYERLRDVFANEGNFSKHLDTGMTVQIMKEVPSFTGLHLSSHKQPISTKFQLDKLIETYSNVRERAKRMQVLLKSL